MAPTNNVLRKLQKAVGGDSIVGVVRSLEPEATYSGFVVAVGKKWVLLARTMTGGFFDGYIALRLRDIERVKVVDRSFESAHARTRPEWPPARPEPLDLDTTRGALESLAQADTLVGFQDADDVNKLWIGVPLAIENKLFSLWEVHPDATWHSKPTKYPLSQLSTIEIGDHYQLGLTQVAGPPPEEARASAWPSQQSR